MYIHRYIVYTYTLRRAFHNNPIMIKHPINDLDMSNVSRSLIGLFFIIDYYRVVVKRPSQSIYIYLYITTYTSAD